jgi:hypothetical protein
MIRLSMAGVSGSPVKAAEWRVVSSEVSVPPEIHAVGARASPLSKTDRSGPDAVATTNGAHSRPG